MTAASLNVWNEVAEAFPPVLPSEPVTLCDCDECREVRSNLGHLRWSDVVPPVMDKCFGSLSLLTDSAFQALLPAYLFHALADLRERNKVLEWTLYSLCGPYDEDEATQAEADAKLRKRIEGFTTKQRAAVRAFLALAGTVSELKWHHDAIAHAISAIWQ